MGGLGTRQTAYTYSSVQYRSPFLNTEEYDEMHDCCLRLSASPFRGSGSTGIGGILGGGVYGRGVTDGSGSDSLMSELIAY